MDSVELVRQICKEKKIPISRLERDLGYSNGYIGQLRKGVFPTNRLVEIAQYLSVSVDYLLGTKEEKAPIPEGGREVDGLSDIYFSLAKDLQDARIDPEDIRNFARIIAKNMQKE